MSPPALDLPGALFVSLGLPQSPQFFDDIVETPNDMCAAAHQRSSAGSPPSDGPASSDCLLHSHGLAVSYAEHGSPCFNRRLQASIWTPG